MTNHKRTAAADRPGSADDDEALAAAALGVAPTSDDAAAVADAVDDDVDETDAIGEAAGMTVPDGVPLVAGADEIEDRDTHRWELDPASAKP